MASVTQPASPRLVAQAPLRFVTATSIFDGHDAAINIIRRLLQAQGAEVVHLGHNRGVEDIVRAALQEDVDGIAVSSYQGGQWPGVRLARGRGAEYNGSAPTGD